MIENDLPAWQRVANYKAVKELTGAIVLGPSLRNNFTNLLSEDRIYVVANCVDDAYLMKAEEFEEKLLRLKVEKVRHILYLSNFIRTKGYPTVLALARLEKERCDGGGSRKLHFDFAGQFFEESERRYFRDTVRKNGLEDYVTYHGIVTGDRKRRLLKEGSVLVLLTRYPKEGQPITILEGMGNGMAVLVTDHGGILDVVGTESGIVIPSGQSTDEIYAKLLAMLDELPQIASINRGKVLENYTEECYISGIRSCFSRIGLYPTPPGALPLDPTAF